MRISFLVPRCTPDNSHGNYVDQLARRLRPDHDVTVCSGTLWPPLRSLVRYRFLPIPTRPAIARLASLWVTSTMVRGRHTGEVIHIQGADAPVGNIITAHCCNAAMRAAAGQGARLQRKMNYAIGAVVERFCMSRSSTQRIIAVSHKVKGEIEREYAIKPERITVIPLGVDMETFHPNNRHHWRKQVRNEFGVGKSEFVVLFVGGDYRLKGLVPLLEAVRRLETKIRVLAVGTWPDSAFLDLLQRKGLRQFVTF